MNMPKVGNPIIVRKANGYMPMHLKHTIQIVTGVVEDAPYNDEGSATTSGRGPIVRFSTAPGGASYYTTEWQIVPQIGDIVRPTAGLGDNRYYGQSCTVTQVIPNEVGVIVRGEFTSLQKPDDTIVLGFSAWHPLPIDETPEPVRPSQETALIGEMRDEITKLKADLEEARQDAEAHEKRAQGWRDDFYHQANMLLEEAERRGWCGEYEEFCDNVDQGLRFGEMPRREKEYEVSWIATVIVEVPMTRTYTARDEESAEEQAKEDYCAAPESQEIIDAIRGGNWEESDDSYREYTVEEA